MRIISLLLVAHFIFLSNVIAYPSQSPVIGIYTQIDQYNEPSTKEFLNTYISTVYVKYVWMSGAQVVPIFAFSNQSDIEIVLKKVNGVLFPGGAGQDEITIDNNRWVKNANFILQWAINQNKKGNVFPIWGTCLGFQILTYLTSRFDSSILQPIKDSSHQINTLKFGQPSSLYDQLEGDLRTKLSNGTGILYFNHEDGLLVSSFSSNRYLIDFWKVTSTTKSRGGDIFVSTLESRDYPIFAVQFHPEKNLYQWKIEACRTEDGVRISQILSNKFIEYARKSTNRFDSYEQFTKMTIYNYNMTDTNLPYMKIYPFKEPRPDDWPYSLSKAQLITSE